MGFVGWTKFDGRTAGFGIVEVIVSMFLLSIMAMAFLPVLVQALQVSKVNASIATATQLLSADLDRARQSHPVCASASAEIFHDDGTFIVTGEWTDSGGCAVGVSTTLSYESIVTNADTDDILAEAVTLILVTG